MAVTDRALPFVCETCSTTGTGSFTLSGAVANYRTFLATFGNGTVAPYYARSNDGTLWEAGYGTISGATLSRTLMASSSGALIDFTGKTPFRVYVGESALLLNSALRWHYAGSRAAWLPTETVWLKNAGAGVVEFTFYYGSTDTKILSVDTTTHAVTFPGVPALSANNTFTGTNTFRAAATTLESQDAGAFGPNAVLYHNSASPAVFDTVGGFIWRGKDSGGNDTDYATVAGVIEDPTNGSEDGYFALYAMRGGAVATEAVIGGGIAIGAAFGGRQGAGTINAVNLFVDSVRVPTSSPVAILSDEKASGTAGGTFNSAAWQTRDLNTESDPAGIVSLSANQFTLGAGTWRIDFAAPGYVCGTHRARLYNVTDAAVVAQGDNSRAAVDTVMTHSIGSAVITLTGSKTYRVEHYCSATRATDGYGVALTSGQNEVYTRVTIQRIAL